MSDPLENNSHLARWDNESSGGGVPAQYIDDGVGAFLLGAICLFVFLMFCGGGRKK